MKKLIAIFPSGYDWSGAVEDGLAFGLGAAVFMRIVPPMLRIAVAATARMRPNSGRDGAQALPCLKIFGQRR
ncbi:MAG TPA: hypothetical protein VJR47_16885 [Stellaceae bacterium]|nr:hypothetical protein [Stellaceae bacterium]